MAFNVPMATKTPRKTFLHVEVKPALLGRIKTTAKTLDRSMRQHVSVIMEANHPATQSTPAARKAKKRRGK